MTRDPNLRLLRDAARGANEGGDSEPPFDDEELALAEQTRDALAGGDDLFAEALRSAYGPPEAPSIDHDALLARAFEAASVPSQATAQKEPDRAPTEDEQLAAEALRSALERQAARDDSGDSAVRVASMLAAAHRPTPLAPLRNELLIARALGRKSRPLTTRALPWIGAAVALAASVALVVRTGVLPLGSQERGASASAATTLIEVRSTATLFDPMEPFPRTGGTSERVDRVAAARASDLRENRFARWGVR